MMKKTVILVLVTALLGSMLAGCGSSTGNAAAVSSDVSLTSDDDILIYDKPDSTKLQLTVGMIGTYFDGEINMLKEFEKQNPDIDLVYYDITGGNEAYHPIDELLNSGDAPDLLISSYVLKDTSKLEDLTDYEGVSNFDMGTLMQNTTDGHVYFLPGPITFSSLSYNKALFKQYGWKLPATLDEFFALCEQITKDTGGEVVPINLNAKYPKEFVNTLFGMLYDELFTGTENQKWLHDYKAGKAFFSGHMEPLYDLCQRFIDAGILNEDSFSYSATKIKEEFKAGKMAMCTLGVNRNF
jgi:raffinose/stachyose/melibiose transport system substrate-binding protein